MELEDSINVDVDDVLLYIYVNNCLKKQLFKIFHY